MKLNYQSLVVASAILVASVHANADQASRVGQNVTIDFKSGSGALTVESRNKLNELIKVSKANGGKISEVQIAAWSDNPVPRDGDELSKRDRDLASSRANSIKNHLKRNLNVSDVETYNMAERATVLARLFDTSDAELKSEITQGDDKSLMSKEEFRVFRQHGQPSKAVALVILKN